MKPSVAKFLTKLDKSYENIITFELSIIPNVIFVGCYVTPSDSPYYDDAAFGHLQSVIKSDESKKYIVIGDLNSRVGVPKGLGKCKKELMYDGVEDLTLNKNGKSVLKLCIDTKLAVINYLKHGNYHFKSKLSFRKKSTWISEPDVTLVSITSLNLIKSFNMIQYFEGKHLYSDHAIMEIELNLNELDVSMDLLKVRANNLGKSIYGSVQISIEKSLRLNQCNIDDVTKFFNDNPPPILDVSDSIDRVVNNFNNLVTDVLKRNKIEIPVLKQEWGNEERWKRLIKENDQRRIWKSINWDGSIDETIVETPSDEDFKLHFENLLNPGTSDNEEEIDTGSSPYIPILDDPITEIEVIKAAESCKESKSFIGITPAIFKCLPLCGLSS